MRPFYALLGKDVYSHVRVNIVARRILEYCTVNREFFLEDVKLFNEVENNILTPLNTRTSCKYYVFLKRVIEELSILTLPDPKLIICRCPPQIKPSINRWTWPSNLSSLGITDQQKEEIDKALSTGFIFTAILAGRASTRIAPYQLPPLSCIENCFEKTPKPRYHLDEYISTLEQKNINQDLDRLKGGHHSSNVDVSKIWELIGHMLQVDPTMRISAQDALTRFEQATSTL